MKAILIKAWADLLGRYWQSALILLSVGAAAALLYLGLAGLSAATAPYEKQMERANGAHAWFYLHRQHETDQIAALPEVIRSVQRTVATTFLVAPDAEKVPWVDVTALSPGQPSMMGYILLEGRDLQPGEEGTALLSASMARYLHLSAGDTVQVQTADGPRPVRLVGLIAEPKACTFPRCSGQSLYVPTATFAALPFSESDEAILLGVQLQDAQLADSFVSRVRTANAGALRGAVSWLALQDFYQGDRLLNVVPILLFGIVAVIAAAMILANIIGGAVLGQFKEIAVLKTLGFTAGQVLLLYAVQTAVLGLAGGALGILGGHLLAVNIMTPLARSMGTPDVLRLMPLVATGVVAIVLLVALLFTALAAWRAIVQRPAAMLATGFSAPRARTPLSVRVLAALRLPAPVVLGVKDAMARPGRAVITVLSLTVCLLTIIQSLNFPGIATQIWNNRDLIGINWDMTLEPKALPLAEAESAVRTLPGLQGYYREIYRAATMVDQEFDLAVRAVDGDWNRFGFRLLEGRLPEQQGEILLAPRAWERLGAKIGDELRMQIGDKTIPVRIVGKYQDQNNSGRVALMTQATFGPLVPDPQQRLLLRVKLEPGADWMEARRLLMERTNYRLLVYLEDMEMPDFARDVVAMIRSLAWVMAAIAVLSITGTGLLTAKEQMREVGIRKAIGMSPAQIVAAVASGGVWFGVIAVAVALPSGYLVHEGLSTAMAGVMGLGSIPLALPGSVLLLASGVGVGLAAAAVLPAAIWGVQLVTARVLHAE